MCHREAESSVKRKEKEDMTVLGIELVFQVCITVLVVVSNTVLVGNESCY